MFLSRHRYHAASETWHPVVSLQILIEGLDQDILVESFLSLGRVDHITMVMALHPFYLSCFLKTQHALLELDGPLPRHWRHYIALMVRNTAAHYSYRYIDAATRFPPLRRASLLLCLFLFLRAFSKNIMRTTHIVARNWFCGSAAAFMLFTRQAARSFYSPLPIELQRSTKPCTKTSDVGPWVEVMSPHLCFSWQFFSLSFFVL